MYFSFRYHDTILQFKLTFEEIKGSSPLCTNSWAHLFPESTTLITVIKATGVKLIPETYIGWSIALNDTFPE